MQKQRKPWQEQDKIRLWILYSHNIKIEIISTILGRSINSINRALNNFKIRNASKKRRPGPQPSFSKNWTSSKAKGLLDSIGLNHNNKWAKVQWDKFPSKSPPWQHKSNSHIAYKRQLLEEEAALLKKKQMAFKKAPFNFHSFQAIIDGLCDYGISVKEIKGTSLYHPLKSYCVDGRLMTESQMIMLLNKMRYNQGFTNPILVNGHTWEEI